MVRATRVVALTAKERLPKVWLTKRGERGMRKLIRFGVDLTWVALTPFLALFIRDNFVAFSREA